MHWFNTGFNVLSANVRKVGIEMMRYLPNTISMVITFYAIFLMFFLGIRFLGAPENVDVNTQYTIVNMVMWFLALMAMQNIGWEITNEATRGTLEQLYMSPVGTWRIFLARLIGNVVVNIGVIALVLVLAMLTAQQWLTFDVLTLIPLLLLTIASMVGVGFMVAGLALVFKQIQAFLQIAQFIFLAVVTIPVTLSPWLELVPVMRGSTMIKDAMIQGQGLLDFVLLDWGLLLANAALSFMTGVFLYLQAEKRAMNRGLLGQY